MSVIKKYLLILVCLFTASEIYGQAAPSPFTTFGIGEPYGNALVNNQGMAGVGVSQPQFWFLNNQNPALLVYNNLTVFQAGLLAERRTIRSNAISEKNSGGNMNYLVTAFPIKPTKWTTSIGLMPYTTVKYRLLYQSEIQNSPSMVNVVEEGKGGLTQLYWSNGVRLHDNFSVGLKTAYIFSSIVNTYTNQLAENNGAVPYLVTVEDRSYVHDFAFSGGVSYSIDSIMHQNKYRLSIGAVYNMQADLNTEQRQRLYRTTALANVIDADTLTSSKGSIFVPPSLTFGVSLSRGTRWVIGTEFSFQDWSKFRSVSEEDEGLGKSWKAAIGGEITPDAVSEKFFKRLTYRVGASMEQYPFLANAQPVKDLGINFGFSLPAGRSSMDLAFKVGKRGNRADNILEEDYFKVYFGITFNDQWFIKRRFD
jgi:hypothetical protein